MLSDRETTLDALGFQPYVDSLYTVIVSPGITPFTIGIYGKWGTGKTSLMRMLQEKLDKEENIKTIWFNAWKFEKEKDIWVALIQTLLNEIEVKDESKIEEAKKIIKKLRHGINWTQMAEFVTSIALQRPDFDKLSQALDYNVRSRIESIYDFEKEFEKLVDLSGVNRLVIFIDDLDRCKKEATLNILEVIKLFLYSKKCVYALGLDYEKICEAIQSQFSEDVAEEYLDKIVQLPFFIPRVKFENMRKFLRFLVVSQYVDSEKDMKDLAEKIFDLREDRFDLEVRRNSVCNMNKEQLEEYKDIMEQQEIIINENDYNPRKIKKFLNTYFMRRYLKENLDLKLENEYIVKFLLLQHKHKDFHRDLERYPNLLEKIQSLSSLKEEERKDELEKSDLLRKNFENKKLLSFLGRMKFGDLDAEPYLLLSETGTSLVLSIDEMEIMEDLCSDDSVRVSNVVDRFSQLTKGRKEYFLEMILLDTYGMVKENTMNNVVAIGAPVVDSLIGLLKRADKDDLRDKAVDSLLDLLQKTDSNDLKLIISDALGKIGDPKAVDPLLDLLQKTDDNDLIWRISDALGKIGDKAVVPLLDLLKKTDDDELKRIISDALGKIGDEELDPLLDLLKKTDDDELKWRISDALGEKGDPRAIVPLLDLLKKTDDIYLKRRISDALGKIGDLRAVDSLLDLLKKTDDDTLKWIISEALGRIGNPRAIVPLLDLLKKTDDDELKRRISDALEKCRK
jgi:HEAT repeat protein